MSGPQVAADPRASPRRVVLAGGSGFLGVALARALRAQGRTPIVLTRTPRRRDDGVIEVAWDGRTAGDWARWLDGAEAVVNLAGRNVACRWTAANRAEIAASRVDSVAAVASGCARCAAPPAAWVQASAIGFYGDTGDAVRDESSPRGDGFLADVCVAWEDAFARLRPPAMRGVALRIGFVLGRDGGGLPLLARLTRAFLGGAAADGRQWLSWIHVDDLVAIALRALDDPMFAGVYDACAPTAVRNAAFMRALRHALRRPWAPPAPACAVRLGGWLAGSDPSLALASTRVAPTRLAAAGFAFRFTELAAAFDDLLAR